MRMANIPKIVQDKEASPGCRGIGKRAKWGGRGWPDKTIPRGGRPRSKKRRMPPGINLLKDMSSLHMDGLGENDRRAFGRKINLTFQILDRHVMTQLGPHQGVILI